MSGGALGYFSFKVEELITTLKHKKMKYYEDFCKDRGEEQNPENYSDYLARQELLIKAKKLSEEFSRKIYALEWYLSCDISLEEAQEEWKD